MRTPLLKLPDPDDLRLRRWVIGLDPARMHLEVCARLRGRKVLVGEAVRGWLMIRLVSAEPRAEAMPPGDLLLMLQRLTITTPLVGGGGVGVPLLPFGTLVERAPQPQGPGVPSVRQHYVRTVIEEFQRRLLERLFAPLFADAGRLAEYEWLLKTLQGLRERHAPFKKTLDRLLRRGRTLVVNGRRYTLTKTAEERLSATAPPEEVTRTLLATSWRCNAQDVKERVARWRKERAVAGAWDTWWQWLQAHPERLSELAYLLEPLDMRISAQRVS